MRQPVGELIGAGIALVVGFVGQQVVMGCFQSTAREGRRRKEPRPTGEESQLPTQASPARTGKEPVLPASSGAEAEAEAEAGAKAKANAEKSASDKVLSVPRATVSVGERERAELKVKNLRDKLEATISRSESVLFDEARLAVQLHREGRAASARVLIRRRRLLHAKIESAEVQLSSVLDMLAGLEAAQDSRRLVDALEQGSRAINDIVRDVSVERMTNALQDHREAVEYVQQVGNLVRDSAAPDVGDADYAATMRQLEDEFGAEDELVGPQQDVPLDEGDAQQDLETAPAEGVSRIPDVPTEVPDAPRPAVDARPADEEEEVAPAAARPLPA